LHSLESGPRKVDIASQSSMRQNTKLHRSHYFVKYDTAPISTNLYRHWYIRYQPKSASTRVYMCFKVHI